MVVADGNIANLCTFATLRQEKNLLRSSRLYSSMYSIEISDTQDSVDIEDDFLRAVISQTLEAEETASAEISLALVDNATIRVLNKQHLDHDYETDVLSFLFDCIESPQHQPAEQKSTVEDAPAKPHFRGQGKQIDGEIIVSGEMAAQQADKYNWRPEDEVVLYVVHGLLHLLGYDDKNETETRLMRSRERAILRIWNLSPGGRC